MSHQSMTPVRTSESSICFEKYSYISYLIQYHPDAPKGTLRTLRHIFCGNKYDDGCRHLYQRSNHVKLTHEPCALDITQTIRHGVHQYEEIPDIYAQMHKSPVPKDGCKA